MWSTHCRGQDVKVLQIGEVRAWQALASPLKPLCYSMCSADQETGSDDGHMMVAEMNGVVSVRRKVAALAEIAFSLHVDAAGVLPWKLIAPCYFSIG